MSHVSDVNVCVTDLDALDRACTKMGLKFNRDAKTYNWWGRSVGDYPLPKGFKKADIGKCLHSISVPPGHPAYEKFKQYRHPCSTPDGANKPYELGVVKRPDGKGYTFLYDFFGNGYGLAEGLQADLEKLATDPASGVDALMQEYGLAVAEFEPGIQEMVSQGWVIERVKVPETNEVKLRLYR